MTPTINNADPQYVESPTRRAIMKTEWYDGIENNNAKWPNS